MPPDEPTGAGFVNAARYIGFGFEFAATIVAGVLIGQYLDGRFGSEPLCTLILTLGAMVGAVRRLLWSLKRHSSRGGR
jgi:F0F1-type ATP synthase assembly protein I